MPLVTGTPLGTVNSQEEVYLEGAPYIYLQDYRATPLNNPDAQGFYWGLSGTAAYPVSNLGCVTAVTFTEGVTMNDVRCDTIGVKDTIQKRDYLELQFTIQSLFPLSIASKFLNFSPAVVGTKYEKVGLGAIDNTQKYMFYCPKVYDENIGSYFVIHLHKAKFVDAFSIDLAYGAPWKVTNIKVRAYADDTKLSTMRFGTFMRSDLSGALP